MMDLGVLLSSGSTAVIAAYAIQGLKKASWFPWLTTQTSRLNMFVSVLVAALSNVGIHYTWQGTNGTLILTGVTLANLQTFIGHSAAQWAAQHVSYKALVVPSELQAAIVDELKSVANLLVVSAPPKA